jgi:GH25 family lysozyme M1 (1,4-beta-N-acetylmuramidase)
MRAQGIDISHWNGTFKNKGNIDFVIVKCTEGTGYLDPAFDEFLPEVKTVPIRGAYHYFRTAYDPVMQAQWFYDNVHGKGFHFFVVDYEKTNNELDAFGEARLRIFWDHFSALTDKPLVLYTSPYVYRDNLCAHNTVWGERNLWMAHYNGTDPQNSSPWVFDGSEWLLWQYTADAIGSIYGVSSVAVDLNVFNGTREDMQLWLGLGELEPLHDIRRETILEIINYLKEML